MARINLVGDPPDLDSPWLVEGLPGVGLVGKIAADHLVSAFSMRHVGDVHCDGIPRVAVYEDGEADLHPPVRLYADEARDLLVLRSDVPVSPEAALEFGDCIGGFYDDHEVTPVYLSGVPSEKSAEVPDIYGVSAGAGDELLDRAGIALPSESGLVSGPTGALLSHAIANDRTAVCLIVESDPRFPDPEAARVLIVHGIEPLTGVDVPVDDLVESAEEIREAKERLAKRMHEADESTAARPLRMYQ